MDIIERVARELCIADGRNPDGDVNYAGEGVTFAIAVLPGEHQRWRGYKRRAEIKINLAINAHDPLVAALEVLWEDSLYYHVNAGGAESNHRLAGQVNDALALARGGK